MAPGAFFCWEPPELTSRGFKSLCPCQTRQEDPKGSFLQGSDGGSTFIIPESTDSAKDRTNSAHSESSAVSFSPSHTGFLNANSIISRFISLSPLSKHLFICLQIVTSLIATSETDSMETSYFFKSFSSSFTLIFSLDERFI